MRARYADPERGTFGYRRAVDGKSGAVGQGLDPVVDAYAAAGGDDSTRVPARGLDCPTDREARGLERGPTDRGRVVGQVEVGEDGAPVGIVQGNALTARVWRPHRNAAGIGDLSALREQALRPVEEQSPRVARSADEELAGCGVRNGEIAGSVGR